MSTMIENGKRIRVICEGLNEHLDISVTTEFETPEILYDVDLQLVDLNLLIHGRIFKGWGIVKDSGGVAPFRFYNGPVEGKLTFFLEVEEGFDFSGDQLMAALFFATRSHAGETLPRRAIAELPTDLDSDIEEIIKSFFPRYLA